MLAGEAMVVGVLALAGVGAMLAGAGAIQVGVIQVGAGDQVGVIQAGVGDQVGVIQVGVITEVRMYPIVLQDEEVITQEVIAVRKEEDAVLMPVRIPVPEGALIPETIKAQQEDRLLETQVQGEILWHLTIEPNLSIMLLDEVQALTEEAQVLTEIQAPMVMSTEEVIITPPVLTARTRV